MLDNTFVVSLLSQSATDVSLYGAKAANLAKAMQLGFAVPEGLVISRMLKENEFNAVAQEIIEKLTPPVAVRSSAVKEDSETKAFAGVFETCLGVNSVDDLLKSFKTVKNSGTANIVKNYHGETIPQDSIAVLIQRMINASRAGIAFSRDPVTGEPNVIIDSNYGLGKSVVDGDVTPDSIECFSDGTHKTFIGRKTIQITLSENGIQTKNNLEFDTQRCSLCDNEINEVANLTRKVEQNLGFPADIEWAFDADGILWLLQARPITTIKFNLERGK
jgi:pyruvate,water dikinase